MCGECFLNWAKAFHTLKSFLESKYQTPYAPLKLSFIQRESRYAKPQSPSPIKNHWPMPIRVLHSGATRTGSGIPSVSTHNRTYYYQKDFNKIQITVYDRFSILTHTITACSASKPPAAAYLQIAAAAFP